MTSVLCLSTVHLTTSSTVLGQARRRARENPWTHITGEILHADDDPIAGLEKISTYAAAILSVLGRGKLIFTDAGVRRAGVCTHARDTFWSHPGPRLGSRGGWTRDFPGRGKPGGKPRLIAG
jgi:hypothetical protein